MPRPLRHVLPFALAASLLTLGGQARADAKADFKKAVALFEAKKCDQALPLFEGVVAETNSPNARIYLARCFERQGRYDAAYEAMKRTVKDATAKAESDPKYAPTRDSAAAELALLEPKVGLLVVAIVDMPPGTLVQIGPRRLEGDRIGRPIAVMPGTLDVRAEAPEEAPVERQVEVAAGKTRTLTLTFGKKPAPSDAPPPAPVPAPQPEEPATEGGGLRIGGYVVATLGLAGLGVGLGLAVKAQSDFDALDEECSGTFCTGNVPDAQARVDDGRTLSTIGNIALITGGVVTTAGVFMIIFGGPTEAQAEGDVAVVPLVGPNLTGLSVSGAF